MIAVTGATNGWGMNRSASRGLSSGDQFPLLFHEEHEQFHWLSFEADWPPVREGLIGTKGALNVLV
jgi:hypothetical protein